MAQFVEEPANGKRSSSHHSSRVVRDIDAMNTAQQLLGIIQYAGDISAFGRIVLNRDSKLSLIERVS